MSNETSPSRAPQDLYWFDEHLRSRFFWIALLFLLWEGASFVGFVRSLPPEDTSRAIYAFVPALLLSVTPLLIRPWQIATRWKLVSFLSVFSNLVAHKLVLGQFFFVFVLAMGSGSYFELLRFPYVLYGIHALLLWFTPASIADTGVHLFYPPPPVVELFLWVGSWIAELVPLLLVGLAPRTNQRLLRAAAILFIVTAPFWITGCADTAITRGF